MTADERGLVLELLTPAFRVEPASTADGQPCSHLVVDGYGTTDVAGYPELPVRGAMLGIPAQADVSLTVLEVESDLLPGRYDLCPVPSPIVDAEPSDEVRYQGSQLVRDARAYAGAEFAPASPAELVSTGFIRSQRVAQVRFQPFQYNPASGQVRQVRRIRVRLAFEGSYGAQAAGPMSQSAAPTDEGPFEDTLRHTLINYAGARAWRVAARPAQPAVRIQAPGVPSCKILVNKNGLYHVTAADLEAACPDASGADPLTFRLTNRGQDVARHVKGEADDGSLEPGDVLLFYGEGLDTKYTDTNVYWLTWDGGGRPMPWIDGTPSGTEPIPAYFNTTQHLEQNTMYQSAQPSGPATDRWYWNYLFATGKPVTKTYTTTLHYLATAPLSATVRGLMRSYAANPWHHTRVYLNGNLVEDATWLPQTEHSFQIAVPQSYLVEGTNTISVVAGIGVTADTVLVNWFEINYYATYTAEGNLLFFGGDQAGTWEYHVGGFTAPGIELYDVTLPVSPTRVVSAAIQGSGPYTLTFQQAITGPHRYLALSPTQRRSPLRIEPDRPSDLHSASPGADYIIITHGNFYTDALRLADYWADRLPPYHPPQKMRTTVVDVQDVYDEFNYGIFDPEAIHSFLAYAYANWAPPAPAYVLLVGDGNYDFRGYLSFIGYSEPNYIPPYLADVDAEMGETAADNRYVCVSGDDILPDMHLGRLPVKTAAQAEAMVGKIIAYEQTALAGEDWNKQILFVADNADDQAGNFPVLSDYMVGHYTPAPYLAQKVYYGVTHTSPIQARAAITAAINAGQLLVNYIGHGAIYDWASEQLLSRDASISTLANAGRLPFLVPMTCLEGYYILPSSVITNRSSLAESIVRVPEKGAIASWSPTGQGLAAGHDYVNRGLFEALFYDGVDQIGPATTQAKFYLYGKTGGYRDLLDTYVLFGDPALQLAVLKADLGITKTVTPAATVQPGDTVTYTLTYANAGPATAYHVVITDTLPEALHDPSVTWAGAVITPRVGSRFAWDVADLAVGEGGVITITAVASPTRSDAPIANTATITATVLEINTANNSSAVSITAKPHNLYLPIITKSPKWDWWW